MIDKLNGWTVRSPKGLCPGEYLGVNLTSFQHCAYQPHHGMEPNGTVKRETVVEILRETFRFLRSGDELVFFVPDNQPEVIDWIHEELDGCLELTPCKDAKMNLRTVSRSGYGKDFEMVPLKRKSA